MERRRHYITVKDEGIDPAHVERLFHAFLDLRQQSLMTAVIDAVSDTKPLPPEIEKARLQLVELSKKRGGRRDPQMRIHLKLEDPEQFALLRTFGFYSIYTLVYEKGQNVKDQLGAVMSTDDSGYGIDVLADERELRQLGEAARIPFEAFKELPPPRPWDGAGFLIPVLLLIGLIVWAVWKILIS